MRGCAFEVQDSSSARPQNAIRRTGNLAGMDGCGSVIIYFFVAAGTSLPLIFSEERVHRIKYHGKWNKNNNQWFIIEFIVRRALKSADCSIVFD